MQADLRIKVTLINALPSGHSSCWPPNLMPSGCCGRKLSMWINCTGQPTPCWYLVTLIYHQNRLYLIGNMKCIRSARDNHWRTQKQQLLKSCKALWQEIMDSVICNVCCVVMLSHSFKKKRHFFAGQQSKKEKSMVRWTRGNVMSVSMWMMDQRSEGCQKKRCTKSVLEFDGQLLSSEIIKCISVRGQEVPWPFCFKWLLQFLKNFKL